MKNLEYKGYTGSIEYSPEDSLLYGKVLGIQGLISYEGETGSDLEKDFHEAIDIYFTLKNHLLCRWSCTLGYALSCMGE